MENSQDKDYIQPTDNRITQEFNSKDEQNDLDQEHSRAGKLYYINADTVNSSEKEIGRVKNRIENQSYKYSSDIKPHKSPINDGVK